VPTEPNPDPASRALAPTAVERWLAAHLPPERLDSARGLYEWMPRQRGGQLPLVDVPYDPFSESHWADAARIADYVAHAPPGARRVLDIGPGDGWPALSVAAARPDLAVVGVDASPLRVRVCTANARRLGLANARFVAGDGAALPFAPATFDLVTAASSIEEASAPEGVLAEIARVLRPGGRFFVYQLPNALSAAEWLSERLIGVAHERRYHRGEAAQLLADAGFAVRSQRHGSMVPKNLDRLPFLRRLFDAGYRQVALLDALLVRTPGVNLFSGTWEIVAQKAAQPAQAARREREPAKAA
jgi:ubiquinone/menaquinone biosynthesis C-methylase UbiE